MGAFEGWEATAPAQGAAPVSSAPEAGAGHGARAIPRLRAAAFW